MLSPAGPWGSEAETLWLFQNQKSVLRKMKTERNHIGSRAARIQPIVSKSLLHSRHNELSPTLFCFFRKTVFLASQRVMVRIFNYWDSRGTDWPIRMDTVQSKYIPAVNSPYIHTGAHQLWKLVIAEATENIKRESQVSESPILPKLNLFHSNKCI